MPNMKVKPGAMLAASGSLVKTMWHRNTPHKVLRHRDPFEARTLYGSGEYSQNVITQLLINNLSANNTTCFATEEYSSTYAVYKAFDGADKNQSVTGWQSVNNGVVIDKYVGRYFSGAAKCIYRLRIWNSQYASGWRNGIKNFVVEGSNDCVTNGTGGLTTVGTWTKIPVKSVTNGSVINTDEGQINQASGDGVAPSSIIVLNCTTPYKAVRLRFTSQSWGGYSPDYVHVRELEIDEIIQPVSSYSSYDTFNLYQSGTFSYVGTPHGSYPPAQVVDGNASTLGSIVSGAIGDKFIWQFSRPINMARFGWNTPAPAGYCANGMVMCSDDGVTWTNALSSPVTLLHIGDSTIYYTPVNDVGAHKWWCISTANADLLQIGIVVWNERVTATNVVVVTGSATVPVDPSTGACPVQLDSLIVEGATATLSPETNSKGLVILAKTSVQEVSGGKIHVDKLGKAGNFGSFSAFDLCPETIKRKLSSAKHSAYTVGAEGAAGGAPLTTVGQIANGNAGSSATNGTLRTGGGGSGARYCNSSGSSGAGGRGGPCCGGAGGGGKCDGTGSAFDAGPYGGPGGDGESTNATYPGGGGAGDPVGATEGTGGTITQATGAGGGLLMLFAPKVTVFTSSILSADGGQGASPLNGAGGGSAGGGCVVVVTKPDGYTALGTVRALGGIGGDGYVDGGAGGNGSVNIFVSEAVR